MTGKYESVQADTQTDLLLKKIANELAERNRLERHKINKGYFDVLPKIELEDGA